MAEQATKIINRIKTEVPHVTESVTNSIIDWWYSKKHTLPIGNETEHGTSAESAANQASTIVNNATETIMKYSEIAVYAGCDIINRGTESIKNMVWGSSSVIPQHSSQSFVSSNDEGFHPSQTSIPFVINQEDLPRPGQSSSIVHYGSR